MTARSLEEIVTGGGRIHLMGVGGAGMAGLAQLLAARGARVSGCDQAEGPAVADLVRAGYAIRVGHDPAHVADADALVHTAAVPPAHSELEAARENGLPVMKRSSALAELLNGTRMVAVAGTHGKTTTTALVAVVLEAAGLDPTALVGGRVPAWVGNARIGGGDLSVVEADEYDRAFLTLRPTLAVLTSLEPEHVDTYPTYDELCAAFDEFLGRVPDSGRVIGCLDDPGARERLSRLGDRAVGYGLASDARFRAESVVHGPEGSRFTLVEGTRTLGEFRLALRGRHNVLNALAALAVARVLEVDPSRAVDALARFTGVERRFQIVGTAAGVTVVDDYAHHPTEIRATLTAARQAFGDRRLVAAFQPHLYSRTRAFADELGAALTAADVVFVTGIYPAREAPIPGVTGALVAEATRRSSGDTGATHVRDLVELVDALTGELREGDVLITLGAGDITDVPERILATLGRSRVDA